MIHKTQINDKPEASRRFWHKETPTNMLVQKARERNLEDSTAGQVMRLQLAAPVGKLHSGMNNL